MMSGTAALAISTTATITHTAPVATGNFWADGFWSAGFWADGFWGVFEQPYTELKPNLKLFVRTELHKLFVQFEVEQIIAIAEANNLSVLSAASALSMVVSVEDGLVSQFFVSPVTQKAKRKAEKPVQQPSASRTVKTKKNLFVTTAIPQLYVTQSIDEIYGVQKTNTTQITTRLETATISTKRK